MKSKLQKRKEALARWEKEIQVIKERENQALFIKRKQGQIDDLKKKLKESF